MKLRRVFIFFLLLILLSSGCSVKVSKTESVYTYTGNQAGSMSWDVQGAADRPSPVWTYHGKDIFSELYWGDFVTAGDVVYIGGDRLTAVDLKTGKELWETQLKNSAPNEGEICYVLHPIVYNDRIVAIGARLVMEKGLEYNEERRNVIAFDRVTGKLLWKIDIGCKLDYFFMGSPVILGNKIYVPALNTEYHASIPGYGSSVTYKEEERGIWVLDINTGRVLKKIFFSLQRGDLDLNSTSIRAYGTDIFVSAGVKASAEKPDRKSGACYLVAFDTLHGKVLWQTEVTDEMSSAVGMYNTLGVNSKVVAVFQGTAPTELHGCEHKLKVFDKNTGKLLWSKEIYSFDFSITEDKLFVQISKNTFACLDPLTGKEIWTYKFNKSIKPELYDLPFTPFLTKDILYIVNNDVIIALNPANGNEIWNLIPYPEMFGDGTTIGSWRFIPVNNGFVTSYVDFFGDGPMISPPIAQLWSTQNNKK